MTIMFRRFSSSAICIQRLNRKLPVPACSSSSVADIFQVDLTRGMAGHSKWANIKHTKGLKDAQKSSNAAKIVQRLKIAVVGKILQMAYTVHIFDHSDI